MGTKNNPGKFDCYANATPDEPMFVLLGRDPFAATLVRMWANAREARGNPMDAEKIAEARACADALDRYCEGIGRAPVDIMAVNELFARAHLDTDPVSFFVDGTGWADARNGLFVVKGHNCTVDVYALLRTAGLLTDKPVVGEPAEAANAG
jgi:hypothetical protein